MYPESASSFACTRYSTCGMAQLVGSTISGWRVVSVDPAGVTTFALRTVPPSPTMSTKRMPVPHGLSGLARLGGG